MPNLRWVYNGGTCFRGVGVRQICVDTFSNSLSLDFGSFGAPPLVLPAPPPGDREECIRDVSFRSRIPPRGFTQVALGDFFNYDFLSKQDEGLDIRLSSIDLFDPWR